MQAQLVLQGSLGIRSNAPWPTGNRLAAQDAGRAELPQIAIHAAPVNLKPSRHGLRRLARGNRRNLRSRTSRRKARIATSVRDLEHRMVAILLQTALDTPQ